MSSKVSVKLGSRDDGTFAFRANRMAELVGKVETMNKRARRTGTAALTIELVTTETYDMGEGRVLAVAVVRIAGPVPRISDHAFLARVEHHGELGNIVTRAPDQTTAELPESLRTADASVCDHCHTKRGRKDTFVLRAPDGSLKRIGRNCLADYLRTSTVSDALRLWTLIANIEDLLGDADADDSYGGGGGFSGYSMVHFLACVCRCISALGWVSAKEARECYDGSKQTTSSRAMWACGSKPDGRSAADWTALQPNAENVAEGEAVIAWGAQLAAGSSDYLNNLRVALQLGYVEGRNAGLVASAVVSRRKELEIAIERAKRATKPAGAHVGVVKARLQLELTVTRVRYSSGDWGVTTIVAMEDAQGNEFTWFASGELEYRVGDKLTGKGTVKKHGDFKGQPQTILTRCSFTVVQPPAAADETNAA